MLTTRKSLWWWLTISCCLISFLAASQTAPAQERKPAAELIALMGQAEIKSPGAAQFRPAKLQDKLYPQDQIRTLKDSRAKLFFQDESILILAEDTTLDLAKFQMTPQGKRESAYMKLVNGAVRFIVQKVEAGVPPNFEIEGKTAIMGIRGTDGIIESRSPDQILHLGGGGIINVLNKSTQQQASLIANNRALVTAFQPITISPIPNTLRLQQLNSMRVSTSHVPNNVSHPTLEVSTFRQVAMPRLNLGEPQFNNSTPNNTFSPGAQGNPGQGGGGIPLTTVHGPLIPKK